MFKRLFLFIALFCLAPAYAQAQYCGLDGPALGSVDSDGDGYTTDGSGTIHPGEVDCDDTDWQMFPGIWRQNTGQYQKCLPTGSYSTLVAQPTEASAAGADYFVDCDAGSDGDGSFASPWNITQHFTYLFTPPPVYHAPIAGDTFWLKGNCTVGYDYDDGGSSTDLQGLAVRLTNGTPTDPIRFIEWPGGTWKFTADGVALTRPIQIWQTSNILIQGVETTGTGGECIRVEDTPGFELNTSYVHDCDGPAFNNIAGLSTLASSNFHVHHNRFIDNFEISNPTNQNNRNVVHFHGTGGLEEFNVNGYTNATVVSSGSGDCTAYKHGDTTNGASATYENRNNRYFGCPVAISSGQAGSHIHHNYLGARLAGAKQANIGGPYYPNNLLFEFNTITANTSLWVVADSPNSVASNNVSASNVHEVNLATQGFEDGTIIDSQYGTDADYDISVAPGAYDYRTNCYFNSGAGGLSFSFHANGGSKGKKYTSLATWAAVDNVPPNSKPAFDDDSFDEDPLLDACSRPASVNCTDKGYLQGAGIPAIIPTIDVLSTTDTTPPLSGTLGIPSVTATIQIVVNGNSYAAANDLDGTWSLADNTIAPPLVVAVYDVSATVTDGLDVGSDLTSNELTITAVASSGLDWVGTFLQRSFTWGF